MVADAWYVYREAPYSPPKAEAWWQSEAAAHVAVTFAGVAVEANDALLTLLAARREELIGAHYSRFVPSDALPDAARLLAIVLRRTSGDSIVTLLRRDGRRIPVEWHAQVRGTRLHAWFRPTT
jgi:PAS domain S-box-containing protein